MTTWTNLLWIAAILLLLVLAWWLWRTWSAAPPSSPEITAAPMETRAEATKPMRRPPLPSTPPPPALAGANPHAGRSPGEIPMPSGTGSEQPSKPRSPSARPPAAQAGPRAAEAPTTTNNVNSTSPRRPGVTPPPAAAGANGQSPIPRDVARKPSSAAPPPAAAGGAARPAAAPERNPHPASTPTAAPSTSTRGPVTRKTGNILANATSWGYQLQKFDLAHAAAAPFDLLVVDYSRDGSDETALRANDLDRLKQKPNGERRRVLAYLSIGEAESYRYYWDPSWKTAKPDWLLSENPDWDENFAVCFWDPGWQRLMCGTAQSYLDKIIAAGFDGVYLDKCDVFEDLEDREKKAAKTRPDLEGDMVRFVVDLTRHAKSKAPGFLVVMQNAENLLEHEALRMSIDAVAKEELLYGLNGPQRKNAKAEVAEARKFLDLAKSAGKPVFVVEYLDDPAKIAEAARYTADAGYVLYIAPKDRELDRLNYETFEA